MRQTTVPTIKMVTAGLQALEFTDCLLDSPDFRENLNKHEKELEKTSTQIKRIIKEVKDLLAAAKRKSFAYFPLFIIFFQIDSNMILCFFPCACQFFLLFSISFVQLSECVRACMRCMRHTEATFEVYLVVCYF